jgi:hypothetical protein
MVDVAIRLVEVAVAIVVVAIFLVEAGKIGVDLRGCLACGYLAVVPGGRRVADEEPDGGADDTAAGVVALARLVIVLSSVR